MDKSVSLKMALRAIANDPRAAVGAMAAIGAIESGTLDEERLRAFLVKVVGRGDKRSIGAAKFALALLASPSEKAEASSKAKAETGASSTAKKAEAKASSKAKATVQKMAQLPLPTAVGAGPLKPSSVATIDPAVEEIVKFVVAVGELPYGDGTVIEEARRRLGERRWVKAGRKTKP